MNQRIDSIRDVIESTYHCRAEHITSTPIAGRFGDNQVCVVETFELVGHPGASRCYGWSIIENGTRRHRAILEIPPIDSPQSALTSVVAADAKNRLPRNPGPSNKITQSD